MSAKPEPKEYRCTRSILYSPDTPGFDDPRCRQGYYIVARTPEGARRAMRRRFYEHDSQFIRQLFGRDLYTVQVWKDTVPSWLVPVEDQEAN